MTQAKRDAIQTAQQRVRERAAFLSRPEVIDAPDAGFDEQVSRQVMKENEELLHRLLGDRLFLQEFGRQGTMMPLDVVDALDRGELEDLSWHNDVMPSFHYQGVGPDLKEDIDLRLWVSPDHPMAEVEDAPRYCVQTMDTVHVETNDFAEAMQVLKVEAQRILQQLKQVAS